MNEGNCELSGVHHLGDTSINKSLVAIGAGLGIGRVSMRIHPGNIHHSTLGRVANPGQGSCFSMNPTVLPVLKLHPRVMNPGLVGCPGNDPATLDQYSTMLKPVGGGECQIHSLCQQSLLPLGGVDDFLHVNHFI